MYTVSRSLQGDYIGVKRLRDGASIPIEPKNRDFAEFLEWAKANPNHGLNLKDDATLAYKEPVDAELEAIKTKLDADQNLSAEQMRTALKKLLE